MGYQTRFKTMCFGENAAPSTRICKFCGRSQADAGWTIWRHYAELPEPVQRRIDRASAPKILSVLRTRWPRCQVSVLTGPSFAEPRTLEDPVLHAEKAVPVV